MRKFIYCILFLITFSFVGYPVRSLLPLFSDNDIIFNPVLIGTWIDARDQEVTITFRQANHNRYNIIRCDLKSNDTTIFEARLGKIGNSWFLDSYISKKLLNEYVIPIHYFSKVWISQDTFCYATLDWDHFSESIEKGKMKLPYVKYENGILVTASTKEWQEAMLKIADVDSIFGKPEILTRVR